jgi:hypothetical protein
MLIRIPWAAAPWYAFNQPWLPFKPLVLDYFVTGGNTAHAKTATEVLLFLKKA